MPPTSEVIDRSGTAGARRSAITNEIATANPRRSRTGIAVLLNGGQTIAHALTRTSAKQNPIRTAGLIDSANGQPSR